MTQAWDSGFFDFDGSPLPWEIGARLLCDPAMREHRLYAETILHGDRGDPAVISTMFMVIDFDSNRQPPWLWETMVFGGPKDIAGAARRYPTVGVARHGHTAMVTHAELGFTIAGIVITKKSFRFGPARQLTDVNAGKPADSPV